MNSTTKSAERSVGDTCKSVSSGKLNLNFSDSGYIKTYHKIMQSMYPVIKGEIKSGHPLHRLINHSASKH